MTKDKWHGHFAILATNFIFGLNTPIAKTIVPDWISPYALTLVRMSFATLIFWSVGLFSKKEQVANRDLVTIFFGALFGLVGAQLSFGQCTTIYFACEYLHYCSDDSGCGHVISCIGVKRTYHIKESSRCTHWRLRGIIDYYAIHNSQQ